MASAMPQLPPAVPSSGSRQRPRREEVDSDEEGRGRQALKNVGSAAAHSKEARRAEQSASTTAGGGVEAEKPASQASSEPSEKRRCHLHAKKPSASCKVCRRIKEAEENEAREAAASEQTSKSSTKDATDKEEISRRDRDEATRLTFSCSPMLKDQILKSSYFKSLLEFTTIEGLIEEIDHYADRLAIYNQGSATAPSCFVCQVYRLFTFPNIEDELPVVLYSESAMSRCAAFLMIRYVFDPDRLWNALEEHLFDDMEVTYHDGGKQLTMSIGEYAEALLLKEKYFGTPLPRIPVKVRQQLEERLAPLPSFRKRMQANKQIFDTKERASDVAVEVCVDGEWLRGKTLELVGRSSTFLKVRVKLEDGQEITSHLGKVVLRGSSDRDRSASSSSSSRSGSDSGARRKRKKQRRSRSRSRGRERSLDWSRWKGKSHLEMLEELRERAKEDAVCGHGKVYPKRPMTFEGFATKYDTAEHRLVTDAPQSSYMQHRGNSAAQKQEDDAGDDITRRLRAKQDEERQRQQRAIFEKYGSKSRPGGSDASSAYSDVDRLDRLRLG
jgi:pre-mRNA-splicing factor 38B